MQNITQTVYIVYFKNYQKPMFYVYENIYDLISGLNRHINSSLVDGIVNINISNIKDIIDNGLKYAWPDYGEAAIYIKKVEFEKKDGIIIDRFILTREEIEKTI